MKSKDNILLEQLYLKILTENEAKFQPHDPEMNELSKIGMGEEYPEDEQDSLDAKEWHFTDNGEAPYNLEYSNRTFNVRGKDVLIKREWDSMEDDEWYYLSLVDPKTKDRVFNDIDEKQIKELFFKKKH